MKLLVQLDETKEETVQGANAMNGGGHNPKPPCRLVDKPYTNHGDGPSVKAVYGDCKAA